MSVIFAEKHPYLDKMLEEHGSTELGRLLGLSGTNFSPSSLERGVRPTVEMACQLLYERAHKKETTRRTYLVTIPQADDATFKRLCSALDASFAAIHV